jgi:hypothetical protein
LSAAETLIPIHLESFVNIEIRELQRQGGPTDWHIEEAQRRFASLREPEASEALYFAIKGKARRTMAVLVECLAVLAFIPGGITAFGCHFEIKDETLMSEEQQHKLKELIANALYNDTAWHKQWYLWQIAEVLGLDLSDQWDDEYPKPEEGIAP